MRSLQKALLFLLLIPSPVFGQLQRLALSTANVEIGPGGTGVVRTYCLDYGRPGPRAGVSYEHVLSGNNSARVLIGGQQYSLQEAIRAKLIRLDSKPPTVNEFASSARAMAGLGVVSSAQVEDQLRRLGQMSPDRQRKVLADEQNPSSLRIVNLSGKSLRFISDNAVLGAAEEEAPSWANKVAGQPIGVQTGYWITEVQQRLVSEGYDLTPNGKLGPETTKALTGFQEAHKLPVTGRADDTTIKLLRKRADSRIIKEYNARLGVVVFRVEQNRDAEARLRVSDGSRLIYTGNAEHTLIDKILDASVPEGTVRFLDLDGFTDQEAKDLARSFATYRDNDATLVPRDQGSTFERDILFSRGIRLAEDPEITRVSSGPREGWFKTILKFFVRRDNRERATQIEIWSRTKAYLTAFLAAIKLRPNAAGWDEDASVAELVSAGRRRLRSTYPDVKGADLIITKRARFMTVEVLLKRRTVPV